MTNYNSSRCVLYEALGVSCQDSKADIRKAFAKLAHNNNPDRNMAHSDWKTVNENFAFLLFAYKILRNNETRNVYDCLGFQGLKSKGISVPAGYETFKPPSQTKETQTEISGIGEAFRQLNIPRSKIYKEGQNTRDRGDDLEVRRKRYVYRSRQSQSVYHMSMSLPSGDFADYKNLIKFAWKKEMTASKYQ